MVFSSTIFLFVFLPVSILIYYNPFFKSRRFRNVFLLIASLLFYAWGEPVNVLLMIFCIIAGWYIGKRINRKTDKRKRKVFLTAGISLFVLILFVFKYLSFVSEQIGLLTGRDDIVIKIALPIGISFFLFQIMSYLFDIYYDNAPAQDSILDVGLYISLFPQLIAGPIVRYSDIEYQIHNREEIPDSFSKGIIRFVFGLGKKILLANYLGIVADGIFEINGHLSVLTAWIGTIAYTLQIYFDFSGYSDMAIGLGSIFGFSIPENFNYPYISCSVTEFWRRWHISLSTWFRDYVYIPLGGNRVSKRRWILNIFTVWLLTGIWHGANWTFLVWGLLYFVILILEKLFYSKDRHVPSFVGHIYTMLIVMIAWVIFRSDSIGKAWSMIMNLFYSYGKGFCDNESLYILSSCKWIIICGVIFATPGPKRLGVYLKKNNFGAVILLFNLIVFALSLINTVVTAYNPFLYFNF